VLTAGLAERCDEVQATDIAPSAVAMARKRCANLPGVTISCADLAAQCPRGPFDLIVFSELGYYFKRVQLLGIAESLSAAMEPGGELISVHWRGTSEDHLLRGDEVHEILNDALTKSCVWIKGARYPGFLVDTWRRK
jgi:protein-L-isoaspartate O-methyltransferase